MRLIDADGLKEDLRQYFTDGVLDGVSAKLAFHQIMHDIDNAPTVDKGYNEGHIDGMLKAEKLYARPNCGAKMEESCDVNDQEIC